MAGHSHASNVKHKKAASASKRAKLFTRLGREITSAVKQGGSDNPELNSKLKVALDQARRMNLPRDNIERAIKKASDANAGDDMEDILYQGFLPGGIAFIVEACTDNRNRTASKVREIFNKFDGTLGATDHMFEHIGEIIYALDHDKMMSAIESGASDVIEEDNKMIVISSPDKFTLIQETCGEAMEAEIIYRPLISIDISEDKKKDILKMIDLFEDSEDIEEVWHNIGNLD